MDESPRQSWVRAALLIGLAYFVVGRVFAAPTTNVQVWRLAAWVVCGVVFAAHIAYEQFRLRHAPRVTAWHTAVAVAIGALALAVAGAVHSLSTTSTLRLNWILAFFIWPLATAIPAFIAAFVAATVLARLTRVAR